MCSQAYPNTLTTYNPRRWGQLNLSRWASPYPRRMRRSMASLDGSTITPMARQHRVSMTRKQRVHVRLASLGVGRLKS